MGKCKVCNKESGFISEFLGVCVDCIRQRPKKALRPIKEIHRIVRGDFSLPQIVPQDKEGVSCNLCLNECKMSEGTLSYCGLRRNKGGRLAGPDARNANLEFYFDSLPTNCVASWVCPAETYSGFPEFSYVRGPEYGYKNLAVFYNGCSFSCLFCQNWHYRKNLRNNKFISAKDLADVIDEKTSCICYFGGDPSTQISHSMFSARRALVNKRNKILRICWETNGSMNPKLLKEIVEIALNSGGCIKFDLKAYNQDLNIALCGITNSRTLENFSYIAQRFKERPKPPLLVASTLLIPGYIDENEIGRISRFISSLNPNIPYSLLGFWPCFYMKDLPCTSKSQARSLREIALKEGLENVNIGNLHILA